MATVRELLAFMSGSLVTFAVLSWIATVWIRHKLRDPPTGWLKIARLAAETGAPLPSKLVDPVVRRQLILRSSKPTVYTNLVSEMTTNTVKPSLLKNANHPNRKIYGFLHPNADAGGGGERVLWAAVKQVLITSPNNIAAIYVAAKKGMTPAGLIEQAGVRFGVHFTVTEANRVVVIALTQSKFIDPSTFPVLTLAGQALGMLVLGYEAVSNLMPDVFVDTTGLAFSYPVIKWFARIPILAYVHYPFVQDDMLATLKFYSPKRLYWKFLMVAYRWAGSFADYVVANSTWTRNHLQKSWTSNKISIVYPPCATQDFQFSADAQRSPAVVYVAQFRPEKRHEIVLKAFSKICRAARKYTGKQKPHLILIGSVRNEEDAVRVGALQKLAKQLELTDDDVTFIQNAPWSAVQQILASSSLGVNAMWNEHFGMGVVEVMAAGLIPVAHASAGPLNDIIKDDKGRPGFLFVSPRDPDYVPGKETNLSTALLEAFALPQEQQKELRIRAHAAAQRFSDAAFAEEWRKQLDLVTVKIPTYWVVRQKEKLFD